MGTIFEKFQRNFEVEESRFSIPSEGDLGKLIDLFCRALFYNFFISNIFYCFILPRGKKEPFRTFLSPLRTPFTSQRLGDIPKTPLESGRKSCWIFFFYTVFCAISCDYFIISKIIFHFCEILRVAYAPSG